MPIDENVLRIVMVVPVFLFSLCVHEYAHAWVATRLGDTTPFREGRLTMHPMAHVDPVGTIFLPILCLALNMAFFGWAKPVSVNGGNMKRGRRDVAIVSAAGPLANFALAAICTGFLAWVLRSPVQHSILETMSDCLRISIQINLLLGFFNLIPLPPLDGFQVVQGFLPLRAVARLHALGRYTDLILVVLLFAGGFAFVNRPATYCFNILLRWAA